MKEDKSHTNNENKINSELDKSVEIDQILDFYKDKEYNTETIAESEEIQPKKNSFAFLRNKKSDDADAIKEQSYGLTEKSRIIVYRIISYSICLLILATSVVLAILLPGNEAIINKKQDELRNDESYLSLKSRYDTIKSDIDELKKNNSEKKEKINSIEDIDNTKSELRTDISNKTQELNDLNSQITAKRSELSAIDESIASKSAAEIIRAPGKYIVGKNIAAGKYKVVGSGKFMVASSAGKSKINTTLGSEPLEVTLELNDIVKFDSKLKFTISN